MYPITCPAGYGVPVKGGKFSITHIIAAASDSSAAARLTLVDDSNVDSSDRFGNILSEKLKEHAIVFDKKRVAACNANIEEELAEPIKIRGGLSIVNSENLVPGSILVYIR